MECKKYKRIKKELAYKAHIFDVYNDYLVLPDGREVVYDLIDHVDGACILPITEDGRVYLVKQYRNTLDRLTYEVPAGCMDPGESPEECAVRETMEETGLVPGKRIFVTKTILAVGTSNEQTYIYLGTDLKKTDRHMDENEFIDVCLFDMDQVDDMIRNGEIVDSKTLIAIYAYKSMREESKR